jgi:hypothetical protein
VILIAVVAAFALIAAADIISRAIVAAPRDISHIAPAPEGWKASIIQEGADDPDYLVVGIRFGSNDSLEYLLVKDGKPAKWKGQAEVTVTTPS